MAQQALDAIALIDYRVPNTQPSSSLGLLTWTENKLNLNTITSVSKPMLTEIKTTKIFCVGRKWLTSTSIGRLNP